MIIIIVLAIIFVLWIVSLIGGMKGYYANQTKKKDFEALKRIKIQENEQLYDKYLEEFNQKKSFYDRNSTKKYEINTNESVYKTLDSNLIFVTHISPTKYEEDRVHFKIIEAKPGYFYASKNLKISDILFWVEKGSLSYTTNISGGGINIEGAIKGALIAGDAGAIIGSRESISTTTKEHDTREIIVKMTNGEEYNFSYTYKDAFNYLIPEKEYTFIQMKNLQNQ